VSQQIREITITVRNLLKMRRFKIYKFADLDLQRFLKDFQLQVQDL